MKYLKLLVLPVLAMILIPLSGVQAQTSYFDSSYTIEDAWDGDFEFSSDDLSESDAEAALAALLGGTIITGATLLIILSLILFVTIPLYVYSGITLMVLGKKMGYKNSWFAWVPFLNNAMAYELGGFNPWFALLTVAPFAFRIFSLPLIFFPFGDMVIATLGWVLGVPYFLGVTILSVLTYMNISEKRGFDKLLGLLILIPFVNLVLQGILAWGKGNEEA